MKNINQGRSSVLTKEQKVDLSKETECPIKDLNSPGGKTGSDTRG